MCNLNYKICIIIGFIQNKMIRILKLDYLNRICILLITNLDSANKICNVINTRPLEHNFIIAKLSLISYTLSVSQNDIPYFLTLFCELFLIN